MPSKPPRPCRVPGCANKTTHANGYCDDHQDRHQPWTKKQSNQSGRGGRPWRRLRQQIMMRDQGLCQACLRKGVVTPAQEVDHIKPIAEGGRDIESNLEAICKPCHKVKTQAESQRAKG